MSNDTLRIEIVSSALGGWWAYITQNGGDRRIIGRCFQTNPEAWKWAEATVERLKRTL